MLRLRVRLRSRIVAISLALVFSVAAASRATALDEEVCDVGADTALGLEDYPTTIALHLQVLRAHDDEPLAHYHLGFAYGMTGHHEQEISEYLKAARLGLNRWDLYLNLGLAYLGQNDSPKAIEALQTAVILGSDHSEAHFNLAIAEERANRFREAFTEITISLRLTPNDPDAANTKAIICTEMGDLVCARDEWTRLVQVAPGFAPARANLLILSGSYRTQPPSTSASLNEFAFKRAGRNAQ